MGLALLLALLTPGCSGHPIPQASPSRSGTATQVAPRPQPSPASAEEVLAYVRALSVDIGIRRAGTAGADRAADFIDAKLREFGYEVTRQSLGLPNGKATCNVIARTPGVGPGTYRLVIGAHFDTMPTGPGANDNASGVGVVMSLARAWRYRDLPVPVEWVAFGGEERQEGPVGSHHMGSRAYVAALRPGETGRIVAMLSLDEVGANSAHEVSSLGSGPQVAVQRLLAAAAAAGVPASYRKTPDWSDNGPFELAGIPAAFLWNGDYPLFHTSKDTIAQVRESQVLAALRIVEGFLNGLGAADAQILQPPPTPTAQPS
ncbi:MAG: M28 family peptidase [Actinomycetota bacterium]